MGLTKSSTGAGAVDGGLVIRRERPDDKVIALAGNPNVGKSTVFNALTGLHQHTGNWPGKTVANAQGRCEHQGRGYVLVDLPGTYSLMAHSAEEAVARDFLCFGGADCAVVVCDATCLERNLNLVLQTLELMPRTVVCVNLLDEARRKGVRVDLDALSRRLGVPVVGTSAGRGEGLEELMDAVAALSSAPAPPAPAPVRYLAPIEAAVSALEPLLAPRLDGRLPARWTALRLLDGNEGLLSSMEHTLGICLRADEAVAQAVAAQWDALQAAGIDREAFLDRVVSCLVLNAEDICNGTLTQTARSDRRDRRLDRLFTSRATGIPVMLLLLAAVFWLTIQGANYPSDLLSRGLFWIQDRLSDLFAYLNAPDWLHGLLVLGAYRTLAWVVSVMLPPMAIFFPLFTLLEDFGYLPRVAFVLDHAFQKAGACGKQALTLCMGFGCNAAGVTGCRIIDSPRERLIAMLTNNFVPCNGRLPQPHKRQPVRGKKNAPPGLTPAGRAHEAFLSSGAADYGPAGSHCSNWTSISSTIRCFCRGVRPASSIRRLRYRRYTSSLFSVQGESPGKSDLWMYTFSTRFLRKYSPPFPAHFVRNHPMQPGQNICRLGCYFLGDML